MIQLHITVLIQDMTRANQCVFKPRAALELATILALVAIYTLTTVWQSKIGLANGAMEIILAVGPQLASRRKHIQLTIRNHLFLFGERWLL